MCHPLIFCQNGPLLGNTWGSGGDGQPLLSSSGMPVHSCGHNCRGTRYGKYRWNLKLIKFGTAFRQAVLQLSDFIFCRWTAGSLLQRLQHLLIPLCGRQTEGLGDGFQLARRQGTNKRHKPLLLVHDLLPWMAGTHSCTTKACHTVQAVISLESTEETTAVPARAWIPPRGPGQGQPVWVLSWVRGCGISWSGLPAASSHTPRPPLSKHSTAAVRCARTPLKEGVEQEWWLALEVRVH